MTEAQSFGSVTVALPAAGSVYSPPIRVLGNNSVSFDIVITGTAVGSLTLQQSGDGVNFGDYNATSTALTGGAMNTGYNIQGLPSINYLRIAYTATSSTGSMVVTVTAA